MTDKDRRLYGKFTLNFPRHPKIAILSDAAFRCLVEATLYSRDEMTDGFLASRYAVARWGVEVLQELCSNDDDKPSLVEVEKGWLIHDYAEHQDTKEDIEARVARNKANGQKGGLAKSKRVAKQPASKSVSENLAETETETHNPTGKPVGEPRKRATRIPADWIPSEITIAAMKAECPNVDAKAEHRKFIDYWTAKSGKDAAKLDWDATWRNWIRRASENAPRNNSNVHRIPASDAAFAAAQALKSVPSSPFPNDRLELE